MLTDELEWCGLLVDYCDVLSAVWTLILTAPIHCRASIGSSSEETKSPTTQYIFSKYSFMDKLHYGGCQNIIIEVKLLVIWYKNIISPILFPLYIIMWAISREVYIVNM